MEYYALTSGKLVASGMKERGRRRISAMRNVRNPDMCLKEKDENCSSVSDSTKMF